MGLLGSSSYVSHCLVSFQSRPCHRTLSIAPLFYFARLDHHSFAAFNLATKRFHLPRRAESNRFTRERSAKYVNDSEKLIRDLSSPPKVNYFLLFWFYFTLFTCTSDISLLPDAYMSANTTSTWMKPIAQYLVSLSRSRVLPNGFSASRNTSRRGSKFGFM